jgi:hypothetical protein
MSNFGYQILGFGSGGASITINITSNAVEQNILTLATAFGYNAATSTAAIIVNIASGVTISGSSTHALRTGALNANSDLTINISGSVDGFTGATNTALQGVGSAGGDALFFETSTGGTGTYVVNVLSGANLRGGGGGGGGGGTRGSAYQTHDVKYNVCSNLAYGSNGSTGSAGSFGVAGSSGSAGSTPSGSGNCDNLKTYGTAGGAGGAAGFALRKNSRTVTLNNSGTVAGSAS